MSYYHARASSSFEYATPEQTVRAWTMDDNDNGVHQHMQHATEEKDGVIQDIPFEDVPKRIRRRAPLALQGRRQSKRRGLRSRRSRRNRMRW